MIPENLVSYFEESIVSNWEKPAFSDFNGISLTYAQVGNEILRMHRLFEKYNIQEGDKIALIGKNSSHWALVFLSVVSYGAVIVPILPDFLPKDVHNIVNHSNSVLLFSSEQIFETLDASAMTELRACHAIESLKSLSASSTYHNHNSNDETNKTDLNYIESPERFKLPQVSNDKLALISYTSGTTGNSKGVMLLHNSLIANVRFAFNNMPLKSGDKIVSFLPLAHSYGMAFEFLFPFSLGCHVTFLTKTPSPPIITQAFAAVKPRLILSVPLIIEKIYKKKLLPTLNKPIIKVLLAIPLINKILYRSINRKLSAVFGGNFHEIVIGGAPFNAEAERFFRKIKFPFTVGYGMTECGPLISYSPWADTELQASGKPVDTLEVRIDSEDEQTIAGEILVRGENVMLGYYKNEEATRKAIDSEGWLHTGDLGVIDAKGNIYIRGRSKSMLLGPSGQNIYPEEIESILNNMRCVMESLVIQDGQKLIVLIVPDKDIIDSEDISGERLSQIMKHNLKELNQHIPAYMQVSKFELQSEEFEKTPKRSIKRFLYNR